MAVSLKHSFNNPKSDGPDSTVVRPSDWNAEHVLTLGNNRVLGRVSSGTGAVEELTGSQVRSVADVAQLGVLAGINTRTASYTLVAADRGKLIEMNVSGANTVTVPNESGVGGVNFPIGTQILVVQVGTGTTSLLASSGVTLRSVAGGLSVVTRYGALLLYKRAANDWLVIDQSSAFLDARVDNLEVVSGNSANVTTVATNIASVNTTAANIAGLNNIATAIANGDLLTDIYQGAATSDPVMRLTGAALQNGDFYFNTSTNRTRTYANSVWYDASPGGNTNADLVAYNPVGAGAVARTAQAKLRDVVSVKDFGAVGNGVANDTDAFIAAHAALPANGGAIYIPAGNYNVQATVAFTKPVYMYGDGGAINTGISRIVCTTASIDVFTTTNMLSCHNLSVWGTPTNTLFKQLNTADNHPGTSFSNIIALTCYRFFESQASLVFTVRDCWIGNIMGAGICINNGSGTFGDQGDSFIINNSFISGSASSASIDVIRGAGFWISGNKFNASIGAAHIRLNATEATGNILVDNNSFEGQPTYAIEASAAATVTKLIVTGNQFSGGVSRHINLTGNVFEAIIANNTFNGLSSAPATPETGLYVGSLPRDITIQGNNFHKIDTCITLQDSSAKILDNTFGDDVARYATGTIKTVFDSRQSYSRHYLSRYIENTSNTVWQTIYKITGVSVTLEIMIEGFVQGVGALQAYYKTFNGANVVTPIVTGAGASAFSFQITAGGEIQFRLNGAVGTNVQISPRIIAAGGIENVTFT